MPAMNTLTIELICLLFVTFLGAGMVKGVTGIPGLPTVAMGVLGATMSPLTAAAILIIPSFVTNVWQTLAGRDTLRLMRRLWAMMLCIVIGTLPGTRLLVIVDPVWSGRALGLALIAYAAYALFLPTLSVPERLESWLSPVIGIVTGLLTGRHLGVFTIPAVPYVQSLGLQKDELVQALAFRLPSPRLLSQEGSSPKARSGLIRSACRCWLSFPLSSECGWARLCGRRSARKPSAAAFSSSSWSWASS